MGIMLYHSIVMVLWCITLFIPENSRVRRELRELRWFCMGAAVTASMVGLGWVVV